MNRPTLIGWGIALAAAAWLIFSLLAALDWLAGQVAR